MVGCLGSMGRGVAQLPAVDHSAEMTQPEALMVPYLAPEGTATEVRVSELGPLFEWKALGIPSLTGT